MNNLLREIMNPLLSGNEMRSDSQGRSFNAGQKRIASDAKKYLDMENTDTLGGKIKESFESMEKVDRDVQQYQRQISDMGRAHNQMMRETGELINFINNPKYRGQVVTIQEVAKSGRALVTDGKPITGYVNSSSIFLPSQRTVKKDKTIKVTFETPQLVGRKTVPTKEGSRALYIVKDSKSGSALFLYTSDTQGSVSGLVGAMTGNPLSPNIGNDNLDGSSSNLFIKNAVNTDPASIEYKGCVDAPTAGNKWIQASGVANNWSFDTCKAIADSQGSKQFALGAESWKLNVVHAGSAKTDYSGTYLCGEGMSNDRIAYRNITYNGKDIPVRLLLYPDTSQYFDVDGNVLGYLGASTPLMSPGGPPFGPVKNCWPTFLHPEKLNYYITYVIEDDIWMLVEDVSCQEIAPGDTSIDEPTFFSSACIKPGLAKRGSGCNVWTGKWKDECAGGASNVINVSKAPSKQGPGIGHVAAGAGGASAAQWGSGGDAGSPLVFGEDCVTVYQLGATPFPTSASKSITEGPDWLQKATQSIVANGDGSGSSFAKLSYYLKGALTGTAPNVSIKWENGCTWASDNSEGNPSVNFDAPTSKVIATKKARNPLGKWEGQESVTVLLSMSCWYAKEGAPALSSNDDIVIAGQFDGTNSILFDIPDGASGLKVGVDGLLYASPYVVIGAESMVNDKSIANVTESVIQGGSGGSNMTQYYEKIGKKQSQKRCRYVPGTQEDGYPVLKNINAGFSNKLQDFFNQDDITRRKYSMYETGLGEWVDSNECGSGSGSSCDNVAAGSKCWSRNDAQFKADKVEEAVMDATFPYPIGISDALAIATTGESMFDGAHGYQSLWCYQDPTNPSAEKKWMIGPGTGSLAQDPNDLLKGYTWPKEWGQLAKNLHCPNSSYSGPEMINNDITRVMDSGNSDEYGSYSAVDSGNPGSGGTYKTGTNINNACSKESVPVTGTYMCGADTKNISSTSSTGSAVALTCPGENVCQVYLYLSDEGELMMVQGKYTGGVPSGGDILWKTNKVGVKAGVASPNPSWRNDPAVWKINGNPVPYIPGNGVLPKGGFLLSANGVYRFTFGSPLKQDRVAQGGGTSNNWSADFLTRFQILDDVPSAKNLVTSTVGGGGMSGGGETTCDSCSVIEYTVKSCKPQQTLKFDENTGKYVIPADKEKHKYSLSGSEVALYSNPNANNTGLYKTFYVDEYNVPFVLNPDAISYDNSDDYIYFGNFSLNVVDSQKAAFKVAVGKTPSDTEKSALERIRSDGTLGNSVKAFNLDIATGEVWLFTDLTPSMELHPPEVNMRPGLRLYMKKPSRVLDSLGEDCSAMVFPAGSKDIVGQSGGPWNDETLSAQTSLPKKCNLPRNLDGIQNEFYKKYETGAMNAGKKLASAIPGLEKTRDTIAKGLSSSREDIDNTMMAYEKIYKKVLNMMSGETIDGQLENSQLKLVEDNYQYIIWSVLAIALVMFAMSIQRK